MQIILLSQYYHPEVGATSNRMMSFAEAFSKAGHSVSVLTEFPNHPHGVFPAEYRGKWTTTEKLDGYNVVRVRVAASQHKTFLRRMAFYLSFMLASVIGGLWKIGKADIVVATSPPIFTAVSGWVLARVKGGRFVLDIRDLWPAAAVALGEVNNEAVIRWSERLEHFLYRKADLITATTRGFVQTISGLPDSAPCLLVPNGANLNLFRPGISGDSKRRELGIEGKLVVGFAGNLGIAQDLDTILEAATGLQEAPVTFLFIGAGPEKTRIEQKAKVLRLGNTLFLPQVPVSEILPYLLSVDVFLVTLHRDPLFSSFIPSKLYDYMACEKAVITNVPGEARRIVEESGAGIAVPPADASALADAIRQLVEDPARREAMGKNGRAFVKTHFDRERIANSLVRNL